MSAAGIDKRKKDFGEFLCERSKYSIEAIIRRNAQKNPSLIENLKRHLVAAADSGATECEYDLMTLTGVQDDENKLHAIKNTKATGDRQKAHQRNQCVENVNAVTLETFADDDTFNKLRAYLQSEKVLDTNLIRIDRLDMSAAVDASQKLCLPVIFSWSLVEKAEPCGAHSTKTPQTSNAALLASSEERILPSIFAQYRNNAKLLTGDAETLDTSNSSSSISYF